MSLTVDASELATMFDGLSNLDEESLLEAGRAGALERFDGSTAPSATGELAASRFVRLDGRELEAGFDSPHQSRARQREKILPDAGDLAAGAEEAMNAALDRQIDEAIR